MGVFILCSVFGQLSLVKRWPKEPMLFKNICSDASKVQGCWNPKNSSQNKNKICPALKCCIF